MSNKTYGLLVASGVCAITMVAANLSLNNWQLPSFNFNLANVNQTGLNNMAKPPFPLVNLPRSARGTEALTLLGDKIPEIAAWYKTSEEDLIATFKQDKSLWVDKSGRLFYEDTETINNVTQNTPSILGIMPLEQTFQLHSKPGAPKTIYLDFNGHYFQSGKSAWRPSSDFNSPPFDTDGNPGSFSDAERQTIQEVWLQMAEAYSPFDVDVTTEEPTVDRLERSSTSDNVYGNRVLFTPASMTLRGAAVGGTSYIGVFDDVGEYYKIALVFPENLGNHGFYMGDAAKHEVGHSLGLGHKGVTGVTEYYYGHGNWAPIMGVGYYRTIVQWSKGEYANASNKVDELQTMLSYGLSYRTDDHGNSISSATNLGISGNSINGGGVIERNTDVDYFKFNTDAGQVDINVGVSSNATLDVLATLHNSSGAAVASSDPYGSPASLSVNVPAGTYYVSVKGTGYGDPLVDGYSNYGSVGQYSIAGTIIGTNQNAPVALASANPTSGSVPLTVQFSSSGSYDPDGGALSYAWNFGDGTTGTAPNPIKTYENTGTYTATLTVTDPTSLSGSQSVVISTVNQAPIAFFTLSTASYNVPSTISLDASGSYDTDGAVVAYEWNFGDGTSDTGTFTSHTYKTPGTYPISLTVTDNGGLTSTKTTSITVVDPNQINAPSKLSASTGGRSKNSVSLKWIDNSNNETSFHIERALQNATPVYQKIAEVGSNATAYSQTVSSGIYYYRIRAFNSNTGSYSPYSNAIQVRVR